MGAISAYGEVIARANTGDRCAIVNAAHAEDYAPFVTQWGNSESRV